MFFSFLKKHNIRLGSAVIIIVCVALTVSAPFVLRYKFRSEEILKIEKASAKNVQEHVLTGSEFLDAVAFELDTGEPLIDLKFVTETMLFALTFDEKDTLTAYALDSAGDTAEQRFSVFLNDSEDYCGLTKLNNGGYAFTTTGRIVYLNAQLSPQTEIMFPSPGSSGRYDCTVSPTGERIAYINSNGLYTNSIDFDSEKLLLSTYENGEQVRILRNPLWIDQGKKILYRFEQQNSLDSVGFIAAAGLEDNILTAPSNDCFSYADEKNTFFLSPDKITIFSHEDGKRSIVSTEGLYPDSVISDNDGRRLLFKSTQDSGKTRFEFLNLQGLALSTAFLLPSDMPVPSEPMALSTGGLLAAQLEAGIDQHTRIFLISIKEGR